jgi:triacylglycerol lipase
MLVHGTGFRDRKHLNYWGRIPAALERRGAKIFYGNQDSWGSIEHNAAILKDNLNKILDGADFDKVNIIAHSKGGLDARFMISSLRMAGKVASLTTVATTHHGSKTIDLFCKTPVWLYKSAAFITDLFFRMLGDEKPDLYTASRQFGTAYMKSFNRQNPDDPQVYYQSYAAVMKNPFSDIILFVPNFFVGLVEGKNDGLVTPASAAWANYKGVLRGTGNRGISHADEVDLRRMDISRKPSKAGMPDYGISVNITKNGISDIRDFYISVVAGLKQMGL